MENIEETRQKLIQLVESWKTNEESPYYDGYMEEIDRIINEILNIYLTKNTPPEIKMFLKDYICFLFQWLGDIHGIKIQREQAIINVGPYSIRAGAWKDGSEEEDNINYFHPNNISTYVEGFTCGNVRYQTEYPNQVIQVLDFTPYKLPRPKRGRRIYKVENGNLNKVIQITSEKVDKDIYRVEKLTTISHPTMKIDREYSYYQETYKENIPIYRESQKQKKLFN